MSIYGQITSKAIKKLTRAYTKSKIVKLCITKCTLNFLTHLKD